MSTLTTFLHRPIAAPHAAEPAAWRRFALAILASLEKMGQARAATELDRLAAYYDGVNPQIARQMREARRFGA